jgi:hypothetical protein
VPDGAVYIGRSAPRYGLRASKWANPFMIGRDGARDEVIAMYERWLRDERPDLIAALRELRGKDLVCWCAPLACHGDVILRLAEEWLRAPCNALPEALDPLDQRLRAPAERSVDRRLVSAHCVVAGHGASGHGVVGKVGAQARHSVREAAHVDADERALFRPGQLFLTALHGFNNRP